MNWASWIRHALEPSRREVDRVRTEQDEELVRMAAQATEPSEAEVRAVLRARHRPVERGRWRLALAALALGGAALFLLARPDRAPEALPEPAPVTVVAEAPRTLDGAVVELGPSIEATVNGRVAVERRDDATVVELLEGRGHFEVDPDGAERTLVVRARDVEVEVVGTIFEVSLARQVRVEVLRGVVEVRHAGVTVRIREGHVWTDAVVAVRPPREVEQAPAVAEVEVAEPVEPPVPARPRVVAPPAPDPSRAWLDLLDRVDRGESAAAILPDVEAWLDAWPDHALAGEAAVVRLELLAQVDPNAAVGAVDAWRTANPGHPRDLEVLRLRATLAKDRLRDCAIALPSYRELAERERGPARARARAWQGLCAQAVGLTREGDDALRAALALGLDEPLRSQVQAALP